MYTRILKKLGRKLQTILVVLAIVGLNVGTASAVLENVVADETPDNTDGLVLSDNSLPSIDTLDNSIDKPVPTVAPEEITPVEENTDASEQPSILEDLSIPEDLQTPPADWLVENGTYQTNLPLEIEKEYIIDELGGIKVVFHKLQSDDSKLFITKSDVKEVDGEKAISSYDITSNMEDGTFLYDLYLPAPNIDNADNVEVQYSEDGVVFQDVENEQLRDGYIVTKDLDHFTVFVVITPNPAGNGNPSADDCSTVGVLGDPICYDTIQDAIDAASDGDTINVKPGTYQEQLTISKSLNLVGVGDPSIVRVANPSSYSIAESSKTFEPIIFVYGGTLSGGLVSGPGQVEVSVSGFDIDGNNSSTNGKRSVAILSRNMNGDISGNNIHDMHISSAETFGIVVYGNSNLQVNSNTIAEYSRGGISISGDNGAAPDPVAAVTNNIVSGPGTDVPVINAPNGIQVGYGASGSVSGNTVTGNGWPGTAWSGTGIMAVDTSGVVIENNIVQDNEQAIAVVDFPEVIYGSAWTGIVSNISVLGNTVTSNEWGLSITNDSTDITVTGNSFSQIDFDAIDVYVYRADVTPPSGVTIIGNSIESSGYDGLWVGTYVTEQVQADRNWWGDATGPSGDASGSGQTIIGNASYCPWLTTSNITNPSLGGPCLDTTAPIMSNLKMFVKDSSGTYNPASFVRRGDMVRIQVDATDDESGVKDIEFRIQATTSDYVTGVVKEATPISGDTYQFDFQIPADGKYVNTHNPMNENLNGHTFWARATNNDNVYHNGLTDYFTYDNTVPQMSNLKMFVKDNSGNYVPSDMVKDNDMVRIEVDATDTGSGMKDVEFRIQKASGGDYVTSRDWISSPVIGDTYRFDFQVPVDGKYINTNAPMTEDVEGHTAWARATDNTGNYFHGLTELFTYDITPPTSNALTSPVDSSLWNTPITITGETADLNGVDFVNIYYRTAGTSDPYVLANVSPVDNPDDDSPFAWTTDWTPTAEGIYDIKIAGVDTAGNEESSVYALNVTYDVTVPTMPIINTPTPEQYFNSQPIFGDWTDSTDANGIDKYQIEYIYDDGHLFTGGPYRETPGTQSWRNHTPALSEQGGVTIRVRAYDPTGNISDWSNSVHYYYDSVAPDVFQVSPPDNTFVNGASIFQEWGSTASDVDYYVYESYNDAAGTSLRWTDTFTTTSKTATSIGEAEYWWRVKAVDMAGNESDWTGLWKITVDNTAPEKVAGMTIYKGNDTSGDNLGCSGFTNNRWITVDWDDNNDTNLDFYRYMTKSGWNTTLVPSQRTGQISDLDGEYKYQVQAVDKAGNIGEYSDWCYVTLDREAPTVTIDSVELVVSSGTYNTTDWKVNDNTPTLVGTVSDDIEVASVTVNVNGNDYTAVVTGNDWKVDVTDILPDGIHTITAIATDTAGNTTSTTQDILIDTIAPSAVYTQYKNGIEITEEIAYVQGVDELTFAGEVTDPDPSAGLLYDSFVIFQAQDDGSFAFANNGKLSYCGWRSAPNLVNYDGTNAFTITPPVDFSLCTSTLEDGEYYMTHQVYDEAVRMDIPSIYQFRDVLGLHFIVDNTAPEIAITSVSEDPISGEVTIEGTASDNFGLMPLRISFRQINDDGSVTSPVLTVNPDSFDEAGTGIWSLTLDTSTYPQLTDGNYRIVARANDLTGTGYPGSKTSADTEDVTIDNTAPNITLDLPTNGAVLAGGIDLEATCDEECDYINFWWRAEGESYSNTVPERNYHYVTDNGTTFEWQLDSLNAERWGGDPSYPLTDGTYYFYAAGKDVAGNWARTAETMIVIDNTAPVTSELTSPVNTSFWGTPITITGETTDLNGVDFVNISYRLSGETSWTPANSVSPVDNPADDSPFAWTTDWTPPAEGVYDIKAAGVDMAGNEESSVYALNITYDVTVPTTVNAGPDRGSQSATFTQTGTATDSTSGIYMTVWSKTSGPGEVLATGEDTLTPTFSADTDGIYVVRLTATDNAGNSDFDEFTFTWVTPPPDEEGGGIINPGTPLPPTGEDSNVLGDTTNATTDTGNVSGDSDQATAQGENDGCFDVLGLCWYWWVAIVAGTGLVYYLYRVFKEEDEDEKK